MLVEYELPDGVDLEIAMRPFLDALHGLSPVTPTNVTAFVEEAVTALVEAARPATETEWGYSFIDSPTAVCGPVTELTARRQVDGDAAAELQRRERDLDGQPGPWVKVETW